MKKQGSYAVTALGLVLLGTGLFLVKTLLAPQGVLRALPYVLLGLGCGLFGHGAGNLMSLRALKGHPELQKQLDIDTGDERNAAIANCAKAKAYDCMVFVFSALLLTFALMGVDLVAVLLLVFAYLFVIGCGVYYRVQLEKTM